MFDILFGWRKASKCKKLLKMVRCRLKLLKNKRCCIVKQLKDDMAQLLKHGHHQTAFERVEQLIMDEHMVQVYDLLDQFCEFIIFHLPYIRKHRDCPNDINEAASTLIFSSARFGELPELISIRKLFGERYDQLFVITALDLLPGNLVSHQIIESLYTKKVCDVDKYRLLAEIASSCMQQGPLFLEYKPELLEDEQDIKGSNDGAQMHRDNEATELQLNFAKETEGKIIYVDFSSKISKEACFGLRKEHNNLMKTADSYEMDKFTISQQFFHDTDDISCSETSAKLPEEIIYLDDIEEFISPLSKDRNDLQDQRLFMFKSFGVPLNGKTDFVADQNQEQQKTVTRSSTKMRKAIKKKSRRRSLSQENRIVTDIECATYYGDILIHESRNHNLGHPCYVSSEDESPCLTNKTKDFSFRSLNEGKTRYGKQMQQPCLRAMTMPVERPYKESLKDNIIRSNSFSVEQLHSPYSSARHIHPNLPDYDELAAKFTALKRANLQNE